MNYPAYPTYKESGVPWLGKVPEHWNVKSARFDYVIQLGKMLQPEASSPLDQETLYLKAQHVQWESVKIKELPKMWASKSDRNKYGVHDGDLLVCEGGDVGRAGIVRNPPEATIIQNALHRVRSRNADLRYLMFVLEHAATQDWFEILCNRSTIAHFTGEKFGALQIPTPPLPEQTTIADFLDRETGRIDTLIEKKRRLIGLLREKRSAMISRTVARGLPSEAAREFGLEPHTRFRDSGIEWLGEVPEGWEVTKVQYLSRFKGGSTPLTTEDRYWQDGSIPWVSPKDMKNARIIDTIDHLTSAGVAECASGLVASGHVLIVVRSGILRHTLPVALNSVPVALNQDMRAFVLNKNKMISKYLRWLIDGNQKALLEEWRKAGTTVESIEMEYVLSSSLPTPPISEQTAIATYLDRETAKIDKLINKVEQAIERLREYRTTLITAAVTGKIDVCYVAESTGQFGLAAEEAETYG